MCEQSGAEEACWAHNPEVRGSKPRSARNPFSFPNFSIFFLILFFFLTFIFRISLFLFLSSRRIYRKLNSIA